MVPDVQPGGTKEPHPGFGPPHRVRGAGPAHHDAMDARIVERREERGRRIEEPLPGDRRPFPDQVRTPLPADGGGLFEEAGGRGGRGLQVDGPGTAPDGGPCTLRGVGVDRDRREPGAWVRSCRTRHPGNRCPGPLPCCTHRIRPRPPRGEDSLLNSF